MKKVLMVIFVFAVMGGMVFTQQFKKVPSKSSIKVVSPGAGDHVWTGKVIQILWEREGIQYNKVRIVLVKSEGGVELVIAEETENDGKHFWKVPYTLTGMEYKIRVKSSPLVKDTGGIFEVRCCLKMDSISKTSGKPGDTFEMYGEFGPVQGVKIPVLNKGTANILTVISWSHSKLVVKIPDGLAPGIYKTGVYCSNPCAGGAIDTWCMVWRDFEVLPLLRSKRRK